MSQRIKLRFYRSNSQLCFSVALYMYILALHVHVSFVTFEVIGKILIDFCLGAWDL